jgi:hypothetical protein
MKRLLPLASCLVAFLVFQSFGQTNVAINKTVTVSSVQTGNGAANAVDNNTGTRWCANGGTVPQWVMVDLGGNYSITGSEVMWEKTGVYKYKVETSSDNSTWTQRIDRTGNTGSQQTFTDPFSTTARYVRITATGIPSGFWASIFEFRVFGTSANVPPAITVQPVNQTVTAGQTATFSVVASGTPPFTYQWKKGGSVVPGATAASYTTPATTAADNGSQYSCDVSNYYGTVTSAVATLSVSALASKWIGGDGVLYADPNTTKVGIGTTSPTATLQVQSADAVLRVRDNLASNENAVEVSPTNIMLRANIAAPVASTNIGQGAISLFQGTGLSVSGMGPSSSVTAGSMSTQVPGSGSTSISGGTVTVQGYGLPTSTTISGGHIITDGSIGIGTTTPQGKLDVNGTIRTKALKISVTGWSDFVFDKGYELMPLAKVEQYLKDNKHLPDMPSEAEVKKNGADVAEVQAKLLQKVEELTLHVIAQQKQIDGLVRQRNDLLLQVK